MSKSQHGTKLLVAQNIFAGLITFDILVQSRSSLSYSRSKFSINHGTGTKFSMNLEITRVDLEPAFPKKLVFEDGGGPTDDKQCT